MLTYLPICGGVLVKLTRLSALDLGSLSILSTANLPYCSISGNCWTSASDSGVLMYPGQMQLT